VGRAILAERGERPREREHAPRRDNYSMTEITIRTSSPRRALLDLAPLELACMNTLWPMGQGTVREIRDRLAPRRPRAYTTIMTIMDRLARKGIVERRKVGRAYMYRPNLSAEEARVHALDQVIENFFAGSKEALLAQLNCEGFRALAIAAAVASGAGPARAAVDGSSEGLMTAKRRDDSR
jgi:BlaI family transcriptional regulator, penicillinase repressor